MEIRFLEIQDGKDVDVLRRPVHKPKKFSVISQMMINIFLLLAMCPVPIKMRLDLDFELNEGPVSSWIPQVCHLCEPRYCLLPR